MVSSHYFESWPAKFQKVEPANSMRKSSKLPAALLCRKFDEEKVEDAEDQRCKMQKIDVHNIEVQKVEKM